MAQEGPRKWLSVALRGRSDNSSGTETPENVPDELCARVNGHEKRQKRARRVVLQVTLRPPGGVDALVFVRGRHQSTREARCAWGDRAAGPYRPEGHRVTCKTTHKKTASISGLAGDVQLLNLVGVTGTGGGVDGNLEEFAAGVQ